MDEPDNEDVVRQQLTAPQLEYYNTYYNTYTAIDQHNIHHQDTLSIERKIQIKS